MEANRQHSDNTITDLVGTVDTLIYASYRANRLRSPEVKPERWALIYPTITEMEERFQREFPQGASA